MGKIRLLELSNTFLRLYLESNDIKILQEVLQVLGKRALCLKVKNVPNDIGAYFTQVCHGAYLDLETTNSTCIRAIGRTIEVVSKMDH